MKEFGFLDDFGAVLPDEIDVVNAQNDATYLVSNSEKLKAKIYAPEINFYLKNSSDDALTKAKNALKLYEARALTFDLARDNDFKKDVGKNVLIISDEDRSSLENLLLNHGYKVISLAHNEVKFLYGEIGELFTTILRQDGEFEVESDFILINKTKEYMLKQSGTLEIAHMLDDEILEYLDARTPIYHYKNAVVYDNSICQYHGRRGEYCAKCVEVCPTVALLKDDDKKELVFSHIDCNECGGCVSVCPSGAMDYAKMPVSAFKELLKLYKDTKVVVTPRIMEIQNCDIGLEDGVLPLAIEGEKYFSWVHFLALLQTTGSSIVFYSDIISVGVKESIELVNFIIKAKYGETGIFIATDEIELRKALKEIKFIDGLRADINTHALSKREAFAKLVKHIISKDDLGKTESGEYVRYGKVSINESSCTLCLSCVGACNVGALVADEKTNSIKFNASLCTTCGYCIDSCAEKETIFLERSGLELNPEYFEYQTLAKDELFSCIECGKEFATTKAVMKVATLMTPLFAGDSDRLKTLYCCADCKAKVMIEASMKKSIEESLK